MVNLAVLAASRTFVGTDGVWSSDANWDPVGIPAAGDVAIFPSTVSLTGTVPLDGCLTLQVESGATLTLAGRIHGPGGIVTTGAGKLILTGNNAFDGDFVISNGTVCARSPHAFGETTNGTVAVYANNKTTFLNLGGTHVRKNLLLRNCNDVNIGYGRFFRTEANTTNLVSGALSVPGAYLRMTAAAGSRLDFTGGGSFGSNSAFLGREAGAEIRVRGKPVSLVNRYEANMGAGWLEFAAAGCSFSDVSSVSQICSGRRRTMVDGALAETSVMNGGSGSILDLHGTAQTITRLFGRNPSNPGTVQSDLPASLELTDTVAYTNTCVFTGAVDLTLSGESVHPVTLTGASTSRGILTVAAGKTVRMAAGAAWRGGVVVKGALIVEDASALAGAAFVDVWDGGAVTPVSGTLPPCRQTRLNGVPQDLPGVERTYRGTNGKWTTAANWDPVGVPRTGDTVLFAAATTIDEDFDLPGGVTCIREESSGVNVTFAGTVGGAEATLVHDGPGSLILSGTNTFTGAFTNRAGTVKIPRLTKIGEAGPLGAPRAAFAEIYNNGTLHVASSCETDRPYRGGNGAEWQVNDPAAVEMHGPVAGRTWWRRQGRIRLHAPSPQISNFSRTDNGTVEMLCPTNSFTANPSWSAGTLVASALANGGVPSSIGAGTQLVFGQGGYTTPGNFTYSGWTDAVCDRWIRVNSCKNSTFAQKDGPCFSVLHPGVTATYTGAITLETATAPHPFLRFDGAGDQVFTGAIPERFHLHKLGIGTLTLAGANAATGTCSVAAGRLDVDGSLAAGMTATVLAGAALGGSGTIAADVSFAAGATLAAGSARRCGTLTFTGGPRSCATGTKLLLKVGTCEHDCIVLPGTPAFPQEMSVTVAAMRGERVPTGDYCLVKWDEPSATAFRLEGGASTGGTPVAPVLGTLAPTPTGLVFRVTAPEDFEEVPRSTRESIALDVGAGTAYPTFAAIRDMVRARRAAGTLPPDREIVLNVAPGDYVLDSSFALTGEDSGSSGAPVVWRAAERGTVRVLGAPVLDAERFGPLPPNDPLRVRVDERVADDVVVADVADVLPATLPTWGNEPRIPSAPWFCRGGVFQDLARWPNRVSSAEFGWTYSPYVTSAGRDDRTGVAFLTPDDRAARWNFSEGVWLYGYWGNTWDENFAKAGSWNAGTREMTLVGKPRYVPSVGAKSKYPKYVAVNVPEELDAPGEWWLDRATRRLYYLPPGDLHAEEMAITAFTGTLVTFAAGVHDVRFENIGFAYAGKGFGAAGDLRRVVFDGCDFQSLAETSGLSGLDNAVRRCTFRHLGKGGLSLNGGTRSTLCRARNVVEDCEFTDFECFQQTYAPAVRLDGCGSVVRRCRISESAHEAVGYGGSEHFIGWNEFHHVLRESEDCGAIYTGRDTSTLGTQIVGNSFHDLDTGDVTGIYFDDCDWGDDAIANVFTNVNRAFLVGGGNLHRLQWNVMKGGNSGFSIDRRGVMWQGRQGWVDGDDWCWKSFTDASPSNYPWTAAYPRLVETLNDSPREPWNNVLRGNVIEDYTTWTTLTKTYGVNSYSAFTNRVEIADNVTASTQGRSGTGLVGFTHLNRAATMADVPGMTAAFARVARLQRPDVVEVRSPDGNLRVRVGLDATARLCCRAEYRGENALDPSPAGVTVDAVDYGRMQLPCAVACASRTVAGEKAVDEAAGAGYAETRIPLEDVVRGGTNAWIDVRAFAGGFAYRMRVPGTGTRAVAGEVARWNPSEAGGLSTTPIATNGWSCSGEVVTPWHVASLMAAAVTNGILYLDVPQGETRALAFSERDALMGNGVVGAVKTGLGKLQLTGALTGYGGWWAVSNGVVDVSAAFDAFGSEGNASVSVIENASENAYPLVVSGSTAIGRPIEIRAADKKSLSVKSGVTARFTRPVTVTGSSLRFDVASGGTAVFAGGFTQEGALTCLSGGGRLVFEGSPAWINYLYAQHGVDVEFNGASNVLKRLTCAYTDGGRITLGRSDALAGYAGMVVGDTTAYTIDLNGFDAEIGRFEKFSSGTLTSGRPATLRFTQTSRVTNVNCAVTGALSLSKTGSSEFAVARLVESTGGLAVDQGIFRMTRAASWPRASFVRVTGTGKLIVEGDDAFGEDAWIRVSGDGKLQLADGVTMRCAGLNWNGRVYAGGSYSSAQLACIEGGGRLQAGALRPTVLFLR